MGSGRDEEEVLVLLTLTSTVGLFGLRFVRRDGAEREVGCLDWLRSTQL